MNLGPSLLKASTPSDKAVRKPGLRDGPSMLGRTRQERAYYFSFFRLAHLATAAFLALALLSSGLSIAARLFPPFEPPIFPNATA
jgi:hypothetical protein